MRAIDADALLKKVERILPWAPYPSKYAQGVRWCMELVGIHIKDAPTIEPERKKGKWIPQDHNKSNGFATTLVYYYPKCSECGRSGDSAFVFCPWCGVDMREEHNGIR